MLVYVFVGLGNFQWNSAEASKWMCSIKTYDCGSTGSRTRFFSSACHNLPLAQSTFKAKTSLHTPRLDLQCKKKCAPLFVVGKCMRCWDTCFTIHFTVRVVISVASMNNYKRWNSFRNVSLRVERWLRVQIRASLATLAALPHSHTAMATWNTKQATPAFSTHESGVNPTYLTHSPDVRVWKCWCSAWCK